MAPVDTDPGASSALRLSRWHSDRQQIGVREAVVVADQFPDGNIDRPAGGRVTERYVDRGITSRRVAGAIVAAIGALGVTASAYLDWYADRMPRDMPLDRLFQTEVSGGADNYWTSVAAPLAVVGVIGVIGMLLRSRLVLTVAGLIGLATLALWIVMTAIDVSPDDLEASDYQPGVWVCAAGLAVLLIGIIGMGRRYRELSPDEPVPFENEPPRSPDY
jgi:hypothetical protein